MFDHLVWWAEALAGQRRTPRAAKGATVDGLDATVRARGVAAAVQKAAASMKIAGRKIKPPAAFADPPGSEQKARVNSAAEFPGNARKTIKK
jgi:hypothetical protein